MDVDGRYGYSPIIRIDDPTVAITREILVYPNPAHGGDLFIYMPQLPVEGGYIRIHDSTGILVKESPVNNAMNRVEINGMTPGVYVVTISTLTGNTCKKVAIY